MTFDIDANGILNVTALEKSSSRTSSITISNEQGRLSRDDIDRMVNESFKFKEEDEKLRETVQ